MNINQVPEKCPDCDGDIELRGDGFSCLPATAIAACLKGCGWRAEVEMEY